MGLDHLDVHLVAQHRGCNLHELEAQIHPHAHVGRHHDRDGLRGGLNPPEPLGIETGRADHHAAAALATDFQGRQRGCRNAEVDEHIERFRGRFEGRPHGDARPPYAGELSGIGAQKGGIRSFQRSAKAQVFRLGDGLNQSLAHPARRTRHGHTRHLPAPWLLRPL